MNRKVQSLFPAILMVAFVFSFAACGEEEPTSPTPVVDTNPDTGVDGPDTTPTPDVVEEDPSFEELREGCDEYCANEFGTECVPPEDFVLFMSTPESFEADKSTDRVQVSNGYPCVEPPPTGDACDQRFATDEFGGMSQEDFEQIAWECDGSHDIWYYTYRDVEGVCNAYSMEDEIFSYDKETEVLTVTSAGVDFDCRQITVNND